MAQLSEDQCENILQLLEDVAILEDQLNNKILKPALARVIFTPILRKWICDRLFFDIQHILLEKVEFEIVESVDYRAQCEDGFYEIWMEMVQVGGNYFGHSKQSSKRILELTRSNFQSNTVSPLCKMVQAKDFFYQKMFFYQNKFYSREEVIRMHANKLGGVHKFDSASEVKLPINEIKNHVGFEIINNNYQILLGNGIVSGRQDVSRREKIYDATELITIDTARIFASAIRGFENKLIKLL